MSDPQLFALAVVLAWMAGMRVYLTVLGLGIAGATGWVVLPGQLELCAEPWVLATAGLLTAAEFTADKIPGVDSGWDLLQTVVRVPAGALLAGAALGDSDAGLSSAGLLGGGGVALLSHAAKSGARALINTSPEPLSNWAASGSEDGIVLGGLLFAFTYPWLALLLVVGSSLLLCLLVVLLARRLLRAARAR
jgi:hypothetical protein